MTVDEIISSVSTNIVALGLGFLIVAGIILGMIAGFAKKWLRK